MAELLLIKLDPQNIEKLFHHLLTTELCTLGVIAAALFHNTVSILFSF